LINSGHGGRGLTQGISTSKIVADAIDGVAFDETKFVEPFDVSRFKI
jgi:glycine/D-amino acid oxidase-like deaminating enzyme